MMKKKATSWYLKLDLTLARKKKSYERRSIFFSCDLWLLINDHYNFSIYVFSNFL